ncbi:MAG: hypothetical protein RLY71_2804 [Pseudomonadota bacterium]|jgi:hypothetical protein
MNAITTGTSTTPRRAQSQFWRVAGRTADGQHIQKIAYAASNVAAEAQACQLAGIPADALVGGSCIAIGTQWPRQEMPSASAAGHGVCAARRADGAAAAAPTAVSAVERLAGRVHDAARAAGMPLTQAAASWARRVVAAMHALARRSRIEDDIAHHRDEADYYSQVIATAEYARQWHERELARILADLHHLSNP